MTNMKTVIKAEQPNVVVGIRVTSEGKDGYTPQRGVDYWTEEDQAEIKKYIDESTKGVVDDYLSENPPAPQITINGKEPDENGNFNIDIGDVSQNNVVEF